ncbi:MAG TPA: DEAD/DEAH box helicase, partial [Allosphingosinicella sp.]
MTRKTPTATTATTTNLPEPLLPAPLAGWFEAKGWQPRRHQLKMLAAARAGRNALLVAPTGAGKTLAGFLPTLADLIEPDQTKDEETRSSRAKSRDAGTASEERSLDFALDER